MKQAKATKTWRCCEKCGEMLPETSGLCPKCGRETFAVTVAAPPAFSEEELDEFIHRLEKTWRGVDADDFMNMVRGRGDEESSGDGGVA